MNFDLAITDELLATTRAVRKRLDLERPVPRQVILDCIDLALQAPTGSNRQDWRWIVIDDPEVKARIAAIYKQAAAIYFGEKNAAELAQQDAQVARIYDSSSWLADNLEKVPAFVIPCATGRPEADWPAFKVSAHYGSIYPAMWSFQLALRSRGLGSTLTTLHLHDERKAADILGIPDTMMQMALLPVAYTKGTDFKRAARPGPETVTHWNHW